MPHDEHAGILLAQGASACGSVALSRLAEFETERMAARRERLDFMPTHGLVAAFSYYAGHTPGNLPLYARGANYHDANLVRLERVCGILRALYPRNRFYATGNGYPLPVVQAARLAGLGTIGAHGLVIIPGLGTWHTLGAVLTDLPLPDAVEGGYCERCGACAAACPFGALTLDGTVRSFDKERCVAFAGAQKELTPEQAEMVRKSEWVMWCDACQNACPHNRDAAYTSLPEYRDGLVSSVTPETLGDMAPDRRPYEKIEQIKRNLTIKARNTTLESSDGD